MNESVQPLRQPQELDSPALLIYPDIVLENIRLAIDMVGTADRLRPHVKTHKSPEVTQLLLAAGVKQFKCSTIAEAEMLGQQAAPDVLIAYPVSGPKIERLIQLIRTYPATRYSCLVDSPRVVESMQSLVEMNGITLDVFLDINVGMNRTGVLPGPQAIQLCHQIDACSSLQFRGLHAYDGHIRHLSIDERKAACDAAFEPVQQLYQQINVGRQLEIIVGGSPSFPIHAAGPSVVCSPGTFVYWDRGYTLQCPEQPFRCAAWLLTRVISAPAPGILCLDLGHKSVAAENELDKRAYFPGLTGWKPIGQSEEHLVLEQQHDSATPLVTGDVVYGIPYHVCPTVALYERAYCVGQGRLLSEWKNLARDRRLKI